MEEEISEQQEPVASTQRYSQHILKNNQFVLAEASTERMQKNRSSDVRQSLNNQRHAPATNTIDQTFTSIPYHAFKKGMLVAENNAVSKESFSMKGVIDKNKLFPVNRSS